MGEDVEIQAEGAVYMEMKMQIDAKADMKTEDKKPLAIEKEAQKKARQAIFNNLGGEFEMKQEGGG